MIKISFCDDELSVLNKLRVLLDQYRVERNPAERKDGRMWIWLRNTQRIVREKSTVESEGNELLL